MSADPVLPELALRASRPVSLDHSPMPIKKLHSDKAPAAIGPYSQGVVATGLLFTAGQIAIERPNPETRLVTTFR